MYQVLALMSSGLRFSRCWNCLLSTLYGMKNLLKIRWTELFRLKITFFTLHLDSFLKVFCYGLVACILIHQRLIVKDRISPRTSVTQRIASIGPNSYFL